MINVTWIVGEINMVRKSLIDHGYINNSNNDGKRKRQQSEQPTCYYYHSQTRCVIELVSDGTRLQHFDYLTT